MKNVKKILKSENFLVFISFFTIYLIVGMLFIYFFNLGKQYNVFFDFDNIRAFGDLASRSYNHYRSSVHPLYVIINQPIIWIMKHILNSDVLAVAIFQASLGALSIMTFNIILTKLSIKDTLRKTLTIGFGLSYSQFMFSVMPETYIEASLFLLLGWLYFLKVKDNEQYTIREYTVLAIIGILSIAVTLTNYMQFIILSGLLILLNKKEKDKILKFILLNTVVVVTTIAVAELQHFIWPSASNYFFSNLNGIIYKSSEELFFMKTPNSIQALFNVLIPLFGYNANLYNIRVAGKELIFKPNTVLDITSIILAIIFFYKCYKYQMENKVLQKLSKFKENKLFVGMFIALLLNIILHLIYGNNSTFLYVPHYTFLVFIIVGLIYKKNKNIEKYKTLKFIPIILFIISFNKILYFVTQEYYLINIESYRKISFIIMFLTLIVFSISTIYNKKKYLNILIIIFIINIIIVVFPKKSFFPTEYTTALKKYNQQIINLKGKNITIFKDTREIKNDIYLFGMSSNNKYLYKKGKLIDLDTKKTIFKTQIKEELIVPNRYTVLIRDKNNKLIKIYENENGLYLENESGIKEIFKRDKKIKLENFIDKNYSEILKVLHQEVLFNIRGSKPEPSVITYQTVWFRDAMIMTMVLEKTENTDILRNWIDSEDRIYDLARSKELKEADNLGELLYIIYATNSSNNNLKEKIIEEIKNIMTEKGTIKSNIDGFVQEYYPTAIAKFALDKYGIDLGLKIPEVDDGYAQLTWYTENRVPIIEDAKGEDFPYLTWAAKSYGRNPAGYLLSKKYPLSYESGGYLTNLEKGKKCEISNLLCTGTPISSPHGWAASEIFLYLYNHGNEN